MRAGGLNHRLMTEPAATVAKLLCAYLGADYRWEFNGQWRHLHIGIIAPSVEAALPDASCFGLLSAWNPHSVVRASSENLRADEELQSWLLDHGLLHRPAFSSARDRTWREPCWLIAGLQAKPFDDLARRFDQLGTLWWRHGEPVRLRMHAKRPKDCDDDSHVDWVK